MKMMRREMPINPRVELLNAVQASQKKYTKFSKRMRCRFCREKIVVDYKDIATLVKLCSPQGKILARRKTGNCSQHQRKVANAIKKSRYMALLPYVTVGIV